MSDEAIEVGEPIAQPCEAYAGLWKSLRKRALDTSITAFASSMNNCGLRLTISYGAVLQTPCPKCGAGLRSMDWKQPKNLECPAGCDLVMSGWIDMPVLADADG